MQAPGKVDRKIFGAKFCLCARLATLVFFGPAVWEEKCLHKQCAATPTDAPIFSRKKETGGGNVECKLFIVCVFFCRERYRKHNSKHGSSNISQH